MVHLLKKKRAQNNFLSLLLIYCIVIKQLPEKLKHDKELQLLGQVVQKGSS